MACGGEVRVRSMVNQPSVMVLELAREQVFRTQSRSDQVFDEFVLTGAELADLGPAIQDIVIHSEASDISSAFQYKVALQYKYLNGSWTTVDLTSVYTDGAYNISSIFSNRAVFGIHIRLVLLCAVTNAGTGDIVEQASLNISAAVRLYND